MLAWLGFTTLLVLSMPVISGLLVDSLNDSGPLDLADVRGAEAIVIPGGGTRRDALEYGGDTVGQLSLDRVRYGAVVAKRTGLPVLVSGGSPYGGRTEAELMRQTLANVTSAYGAKFELSVDDSNPVTYNDPQLVEQTLPTIRRVVGDANVVAQKPLMPAEDFSYYQKVIPGFFYFLGVGNKAKGLMPAWHTSDFDVDEESLVIGVKVMSNVLLDYLDRQGVRK